MGSPSPLVSGRASLLPPSVGAENCEVPPPPPTWKVKKVDIVRWKTWIKPGWHFRRQNQSPSHPKRKESGELVKQGFDGNEIMGWSVTLSLSWDNGKITESKTIIWLDQTFHI